MYVCNKCNYVNYENDQKVFRVFQENCFFFSHRGIKVKVHEILFFAQKIEKYVKFNMSKDFIHFKDFFQVFTHF